MKRRSFLTWLAAPALLALLPRARAAGPLLFHEHGHGLAFSPDGKTLLAPSREGLAVYEDGSWWQAPGPEQGFSGFSVAQRAIYSSGHSLQGAAPGTPAGLLRSTDGGRSWQPLALAGEADFQLLAAGYHSDAIYVINARPNSAMPSAGIYVSFDEGRHWGSRAARGLSGEIHGLAAHPMDARIVALGTGSGLYLSRDAGESFALLGRSEPVTAVTFDHEGERLIYARALANDLGERKLAGRGQRPVRLPPLAYDYVTSLAHSPTDARTVAFATRKLDVYLTRDGGETWRRIASAGEAQHETDENHVRR